MSQTFILGTNNKFSLKVNRWLFITLGMLFILMGTANIYVRPFDTIGIVLAFLQILVGLFNLIYAWIGLSEKSKYSPKASFYNTSIVLKNSFWSKSIKIDWANVTTIEFRPFQLLLSCKDGDIEFDYVADANTSIAIKEYIRAQASNKGIKVIGG